MKEELLAELAKIVEAVNILSPTAFSFAGRVVPQYDPAMQQLQSLYPTQNPLITQLQQQLYGSCYCRRFTGYLQEEAPGTALYPATALPGHAERSEGSASMEREMLRSAQHDMIENGSFLQELSEANSSQERWDSGWQIYQTLPSGQILAHKYGVTRMVWPGEFIAHDGFGMAPRVGANISILIARESRTMQPGFYFVFGETVTDQEDDYSIVRFYWNITDSTAPGLIRLISRRLNRFQVPFRFKCLSFRAQFKRADAAVLFLSKRYYRITAELLGEIYQQVRTDLKPETPLFTRKLASGLGFAEDPGNGESFGMSRCRILAEGLWSAYIKGLPTQEARLQEVVAQFEKNGIALAHPYLNARSIDHYEFTSF